MAVADRAEGRQGGTGIGRGLVLVMAVSTGLAVASNYYAQPLLPVMAATFHLSASAAGLIVTVAQIGYAAGLLFLVPLGDLLERRRLVTVMGIAVSAALFALSAAPSAPVLFAAAALVGLLSVQAQVLVPFAAALASDHERGRVVGTVMSGLLLGILLARTAAGYVAELGTWRLVYALAGALMLVEALVLSRVLPSSREHTDLGYARLLRSVAGLVKREPVLRLRAAYGAFSFATFSVLWTSMAFLLAAPPYRFGPGTIGLFGLAGAAGAAAASFAGRLADRGLAPAVTLASALLLTASWLPLWLGARSLPWLVLGILVLDAASQALHITNQSEIYRLHPSARARLTSAYMTTYFVGGAVGSASSAVAFQTWGWHGASAVGGAFAAGTLVVWLLSRLHVRGV